MKQKLILITNFLPAFLFLFVPSLMADSITKPFTFVPGTQAKASEVNANFDALYNQVNKMGSAITVDFNSGKVGIGTANPE